MLLPALIYDLARHAVAAICFVATQAQIYA